MNVSEVGEIVTEHAEAGHSHEGNVGSPASGAHEGFRRRTAVLVGVMGMLLAIASLGGEYNMKETINTNILASDTYSFYQARNARETSYQLAADGLADLLAREPALPQAARSALEQRMQTYLATVQRYESDPKTGDGKRELLAKAQRYESQRDLAQHKDISFDFARAFYEIAIVLASVSIVAASRQLLWLAGTLAAVATVLSLNGFLPFFDIPLH